MKRKPPSTRSDSTVEMIYGQKVEDPYRWLENAESEETKLWVEKQNHYTRSILDSLPGRNQIKRRLEQLLSIGQIGTPQVYRGLLFYTKREGQENQPILYLREGRNGREKVLVDPMHACKMTARLQAATSSDAPILLRYETQAGHVGSPLSKNIEEYTDIWSFVFWQMGMK